MISRRALSSRSVIFAWLSSEVVATFHVGDGDGLFRLLLVAAGGSLPGRFSSPLLGGTSLSDVSKILVKNVLTFCCVSGSWGDDLVGFGVDLSLTSGDVVPVSVSVASVLVSDSSIVEVSVKATELSLSSTSFDIRPLSRSFRVEASDDLERVSDVSSAGEGGGCFSSSVSLRAAMGTMLEVERYEDNG